MGGKEKPTEGGEIIELFPRVVDATQSSLEELLFSGLSNEEIVQAIFKRLRPNPPTTDNYSAE